MITRREAIAGAALLALSGCGDKPVDVRGRQLRRKSIAIDYASFYAPIDDMRRLISARARRRGAIVRFSADPAGSAAQLASLRPFVGPDSGYGVVVIAPFDAAAVDPLAADAIGRGIDVVSYIVPLAHETTGITVDVDAAVGLLAGDATRWAREHGARTALLVAPPARSPVPDPFAPYARDAARRLAKAVAAGPLRVTGTVTALGQPDAEQAVRAAGKADVVLCWNDATALGAASAVGSDAYVGALGAPGIASVKALDALDAGGPLRALVAPRLSTLADALVDVPLALLRGDKAQPGAIAPQLMRRAGAARADYAR